jgi:hypothetical protein
MLFLTTCTPRAMTARTRLRDQSQQSQSLDESNLFGGARAALTTASGHETDASGHHQLGANIMNPGSASSGELGARAAESYYSKDDRRDPPRGVTQQERGIEPVEMTEQQRGGREVGFIAMLFKVCSVLSQCLFEKKRQGS